MTGQHRASRCSGPGTILVALAAATLLAVSGCGVAFPSAPGGGSAATVSSAPLAPASLDPSVGDPGDPIGALPDPGEGDVPPAEESPVLAGRLVLGTPGDGARTAVGTSGGTVTAAGLSIEIRQGALAAETAFTVTPTPITGLGSPADYGGAVRPLTSLYAIDAGSADLSVPAAVTLDLAMPELPADTVPMLLYYDRATGRLSPLGPLNIDGTHVTASAPHFSDVFGALVDLARLPAAADSGFRPGVDDWQFTNFGSFIATGGQCGGQTLTEIWYYLYQHKAAGAPHLYGLYDNNGAGTPTPKLWQDDSEGYRLAAAVHADPYSDLLTYTETRDAGWNAPDDRMTFAAFRAAIALRGEPQMIRITDNVANGGHTMVVYRVAGSRLFVADPNYPGKLRTIRFDAATGKLGPYSSGASATTIAANGATSYTHFALVPWESSVNAAGIAARWAEFKANRAGDTSFPQYTLVYDGGTDAAGKTIWKALVDGVSTTDASLRVAVTSLIGGAPTVIRLYRGTSATPTGGWGWNHGVDLAPGPNPIGLLVEGKVGTTWHYVDFVRLTIDRTAAASPTAVAGGRWVLTSTTTDGPRPSSFSKPGETLTIQSAPGSVSIAYNYDGPPHRNETASLGWGVPPSSAAPGEAWTTTFSASGTCRYDLDLGGWAAAVSANLIWHEAGEPRMASFVAAARCEKPEASTAVSWTFPAKGDGAGDAIDIYISASEEHTGDSWTYHYEWQP